MGSLASWPDSGRPGAHALGLAAFALLLLLAACGDDGSVDIANLPPVVLSPTVEVPKNVATSVELQATDPDGDPLTYRIEAGLSHGTLVTASLGEGRLRATYTPETGFSGQDAFSYAVSDGEVEVQGTVTLVILDRAPLLSAPTEVVRPRAQEDGAVGVTVEATDPDGDPLVFTVQSGPEAGVLTPFEIVSETEGSAGRTVVATALYRPDPGSDGADAVQVVASDGANSSAPATIGIVVNGLPEAMPVEVATDKGVAVFVDLGGVDPDGDPLEFEVVDGPVQGSLGAIVEEAGQDFSARVLYTPPGDGTGTFTFTYRVRDALDASQPAEVAVSVENRAPVAQAASAATGRGVPVGLVLRASDPDADALQFLDIQTPPNGAVSAFTQVAPGVFEGTYTPAAGFAGLDAFTYRVTDGADASEPATITVEVVNQAPSAVAATATVARGGMVTVALSGSDPDGDPLTFEIVTPPAEGTLGAVTPVGPTSSAVAYTAGGAVGAFTFSYRADDGVSVSPPATVSVDVTNQVPQVADQAETAPKNGSVTIALAGTDADGDPLTFAVGTPSDGALSAVTSTGPAGAEVTYTPPVGFDGVATFNYTASDGANSSAPATVTVTVPNQVPTTDPVAAQNAVTGATITIPLTGSDPDGDPLTFRVASAPGSGSVDGITRTGDATADLSFTAPGAGGGVTFEVEAFDGTDASAPVTVTVTVDAPPTADDQAVATDEDTPLVILLSGSDPDGTDLTFTVVTPPSNGTLGALVPGGAPVANASVTYTPAADFFGSDQIVFRVTDGAGLTAQGTVDLAVDAVNDPPSFTAGPAVAVPGGATPYTQAAWATAIDPGAGETFGAGAGFSVTNDNNGLFDVQPAVALDGTLTFTPAAATRGVVNVDVTLADGDGATTGPQSFIITVNSAPAATDQTVSTDESTPLVITLAGTDADGDALTFAIATPPSGGSLGPITQLTPTTVQVTYTPTVGQIGDRSFTFTVNDGTTDSAPGTVTLTVDDVPETLAVAGVGNTQIATAGLATAPTTPAVTLASGVLATTPSLTIQDPGVPIATTQGGSVTLEADGDFLYTPPLGFTGADDFDYTVTTGATATVNVTVTGTVWYVDNRAGGGGTGQSDDPFNTLAAASAAAGTGEIIFVDDGDGTTTGMDAGITLLANQELIGEPAGLTVGGVEVVAAVPGGPTPQITNGGGTAVTLGDGGVVTGVDIASPSGAGLASSAAGGTVTDVSLNTPGGAGISLTGATGTFTLTGLDVNDAVGHGIHVDGGSATVDITLTTGSLDNAAGNAVRVENTTGGSVTIGGGPINETGAGLYMFDNAGSVTVNSVVTVTNPSGVGVDARITSGNVTFADLTISTTGQIGLRGFGTLASTGTLAVTTGSVEVMDEVAVDLFYVPVDMTFTSVSMEGAARGGVVVFSSPGTLDLGTLSVVNSDGRGLQLSNTQATPTVSVAAGSTLSNSGPLSALLIFETVLQGTGGGPMTFASVTSTNSGRGIWLEGNSGDLVINGGALTGAPFPNPRLRVGGGSGDVTYAGDIINSSGQSVEIVGRTGGTVTLSGAITDTGTGILVENNSAGATVFSGTSKSLNTGASPAVQLLNNTGHTVSFTNGGLDVDATSGAGFTATGGGTVTVEGGGNSVTTTTGAPVTMTGTQVGGAGMTFESVSANGATNGIALSSATGGSGTFRVTGTGSTDGSGGTIQSTTGDAISLTSVANVSLANMILGDGTAVAGQAPDGTNNVAGGGITLNGVDDLTLDNVLIARTGGDGIGGTGVTGATFTDVTILNAGDGNDEHGIDFGGIGANNLDGTVVMTDVVVDGAFNTGMVVQNSSGTLNLTVQGTSVSACRFANTTGAAFGDDGMLLDARGSASMTVVVDQCTFEDLESDGIAALAQEAGGAALDLTVSNSTFTGCAAGTCSATGSDNALSIRTAGSATLDFDVLGNQLGANNQTVIVQGNNTSVLRGTLDGNTIGTGATDSGSRTGRGIDIFADDASLVTVQVSDNTIRNTDFEGIYAFANDGSGLSPSLNATILSNTVATPDDNSAFPLGVPSTEVTGRNLATVCADIRSNQVSLGTGGFSGIRVRQREGSTFTLERLTAGSQSAATADTHVTSENPGATGVTATADVSFTGVADGACATPP